jgi:CheY-like chemotaxis protein
MEAGLEDKTVLVVDDENDVVRYLSSVLEDAGFKVITAEDGNEALLKIKTSMPDLISLDMVMPGGSGVKLHRELKKNPQWSSIPILVVTGHARDDAGQEDLNEMTMSGPGVYLEKPVNADTYVRAVKKVLGMVQEPSHEHKDLKTEAKKMLETADAGMLEEILKILKKKRT